MQINRSFSFLAAILLFAEMFSPMLYAEPVNAGTPSVLYFDSPTSDCQVREISPVERTDFWNSMLPFQGSEINDLTLDKLGKNKVGDITPPKENNPLNDFTFDITKGECVDENGITVKEATSRLGIKLNDKSEPERSEISYQECDQLYKSSGKKGINLAGLLGKRGATDQNKLAKADSEKVIIPEGSPGFNEVLLSQATGLKIQKTDLLNGLTCTGKITYSGVLADNLLFTNTKSDAIARGTITDAPTGKDISTGSVNNHVSAPSTTLFLNDKGGGNVLVPSFLIDWTRFTNSWSRADLFAGIALTTFSIIQTKKIVSQVAPNEEIANIIKAESSDVGRIEEARAGFQAAARGTVGVMTAGERDAINTLVGNNVNANAAEISRVESDILSGRVGGITAGNENDAANYFRAALSARQFDNKHPPYNTAQLTSQINSLKLVKTVGENKLASGLMMGGFFLGPARLAFGMNDAIYMQLSDTSKKAATQGVLLYGDGREVGKDWREATDIFGGGTIADKIGELSGGSIAPPGEAWVAGTMHVINSATSPDTAVGSGSYQTTFKTVTLNGQELMSVGTDWTGPAYSLAVDQVNDNSKFSKMQFTVKDAFPSPVLNTVQRKDAAQLYSQLIAIAIPFLVLRNIRQELGSENLGRAVFLLTEAQMIKVDDSALSTVDCKKVEIENLKTLYREAEIASYLPLLPAANYWFSQVRYLGTLFGTVLGTPLRVANALSLPQLFQYYYVSRATSYLTHCVDPQYLLVSYKKVDAASGNRNQKPVSINGGITVNVNAPGTQQVNDISKQVGDAFGKLQNQIGLNAGPAKSPAIQDLPEALSFTAKYPNGMNSNIAFQYLTYPLDTKFATCVKSNNAFDALNNKDAKPMNIESKDGKFVSLTKDGVTLGHTDPTGTVQKDQTFASTAANPDWGLRALYAIQMPALAKILLINKLVETNPLKGSGSNPVITVGADGSIIADGTNPATNCLMQKLMELTGKSLGGGNDLTGLLGKAVLVRTTRGSASINNNYVSFTYEISIKKSTTVASGVIASTTDRINSLLGNTETPEPGSELSQKIGDVVTAPSLDFRNKNLDQRTWATSSLNVMDNAEANLNGPSGDAVNNIDLGQFSVLQTDRGASIHYDSRTGRLLMLVPELAATNSNAIKSISASTASNPDGKGNAVPAVRINNVQGKLPGDQSVSNVNNALDKIQQNNDGSKGGMQSFDTADHTYQLTTDANGKPVLRVIDKKTGAINDYPLTGAPYVDSQGNVVFPTDKGLFKLNIGENNGQPTLTATSPDKGILDNLAALRGGNAPGGSLTFNPSTGAIQVFNGQGIPLDNKFADQGIGYFGTPDGVKGVPTSNPFGSLNGQGENVTPPPNALQLPSWPEDLLLIMAMISLILGGVLTVRRITA